MTIMNNTIGLSTTAFFNDRGCHVRIEQIMKRLGVKHLIAYSAGRDRDSIETERIHSPEFLNKDHVGFKYSKIILDSLVLNKLLHLIREKKPDAILAFTHEAGIVAVIASALTHTPFILDYQGSLSGEMQSYNALTRIGPVRLIIQKIERFIERKAYAIIYNTQFSYNKSCWKQKYLMKDNYIPDSEKQIASFREGDESIILWMGLLTKRQGIDDLLFILKELMNKKHLIKFVIVGHSEQLVNLRSRYSNAIFTGRVDFEFIPSIIRDADICISTKEDSEEGSHKLHMFKKYGKRIIALRSKAAEEMLNNEEIVDDSSEMIKRIMEII